MSLLNLIDRTELSLAKHVRVTSLRLVIAVCAVLPLSSVERANSADWPLRGSLAPTTTYARWDGWQFGLSAGYGNMNTDFGNSTSSLVSYILRNSTLEAEGAPSTWTALPSGTANGTIFGAFLAYNMQWDQLVVGVDLSYKHPSLLQISAGDSLRRLFDTSDEVQHDVTISAQSSFKLVDYAALRARAGYAVGDFLPYAAVGIAAGRFNYQTTVTVTDVMTDLNPPGPTGGLGTFQQSASAGQANVFVAGVAAGLGVDWAVTPSVFLRGEWEFVAFAPVNQTRANIQVGHVGVGMRF
jgi:opacity protein-like surface antigen